MRKFSNKMVLSILTLVLLVVALGTTTYAWFTVGNIAKVDQFETNVASGSGLEVAYLTSSNTTPDGFKRTIGTAEITKNLALDYGLLEGQWATHFKLFPVTSVNGRDFTKLSASYNSLEAATKADGYVEFKLRFRTVESNAKLVWKGVTLDSTGVNWTPEVAFNGISGSPVSTAANYHAKNAARISVYDGTNTVVYELADEAGQNKQLSNNEPTWNQGAHDYFAKITGYNLSTSHSAYRAVTTVTTLGPTGTQLGNISTVSGEYFTIDVTIRIYLEGFDSETFNAILKDKIQVAFEFTMIVA